MNPAFQFYLDVQRDGKHRAAYWVGACLRYVESWRDANETRDGQPT